MIDVDPVMSGHLEHVVNSLVNQTQGRLRRSAIRAIVYEAYEEISEGAKVDQFLPLLTLRQAQLLLKTRERAADHHPWDLPSVLLVCGTNAGRSQVAASLIRFYAPGRLEVVSAGQNPREQTLPEVVAYMRGRGVELTDYPKRLRPEYVEAADHIIFVGSNSTAVPAEKDTERWPIAHMTGLSRIAMREAIMQIDDRVRTFVQRVQPDIVLPRSVFEPLGR